MAGELLISNWESDSNQALNAWLQYFDEIGLTPSDLSIPILPDDRWNDWYTPEEAEESIQNGWALFNFPDTYLAGKIGALMIVESGYECRIAGIERRARQIIQILLYPAITNKEGLQAQAIASYGREIVNLVDELNVALKAWQEFVLKRREIFKHFSPPRSRAHF
jgi:hypothetical protein